MKLAYKKIDNVIHLPIEKVKPKTIEYVFQLMLNLFALYIANKITIDIWRSLTGH